MEEKIIHSTLRYNAGTRGKPVYVIAYFETGISDVKINEFKEIPGCTLVTKGDTLENTLFNLATSIHDINGRLVKIEGQGVNVIERDVVYVVGDCTYSKDLPSWARLDCVTQGKTSTDDPIWPANPTVGQAIADGSVVWIISDIKTDASTAIQRKKQYEVGDVAYSQSLPSWARLDCISGGTTDASDPIYPTSPTAGQTITDGNVVWQINDVKSGMSSSIHRKTKYEVGDCAFTNKLPSWARLDCIAAGTTGDTDPIFPTSPKPMSTIVDGGVTWMIHDIKNALYAPD